MADVSDNRPILQLLNEAKAEVVIEIEDLDESSVSFAAKQNQFVGGFCSYDCVYAACCFL